LNTYRLAIFDLDGTLLDSLDDLANSANQMLEEEGFPTHEVNLFRHFVGDGARTLVERILPEEARRPDVIDRCLLRYGAIYGRRWDEQSRAYDDIPELLEALAARGIGLAVLSNKPQAATSRCVARFFGDREWIQVIGQRDGRPKKPDPAGIFDILAATGVRQEETVYLGDTDTDMKAAVAAGVFPVGVLWGFRGREELETHGARALLRGPLDLLKLLDPS